MAMLERTEQRILGVLIEKELSVPDSYPMSENALVDGCNQKSNREPVMELVPFQVAGALMALQEKEWLARIDGGGRVPKFRHRVVDRLALDRSELAVMAELLLRGPQAPGALKPRVQRMGYHGTPEQIEALLQRLGARTPPLVTQQPLAPRERDQRWRHLLGPGSEATAPAAAPVASSTDVVPAPPVRMAVVGDDLAERVAALEDEVRVLRAAVDALKER